MFQKSIYEISTKMVQEQWLQLKLAVLFFYWVELTFGGREQTFRGEGVNEQIFGLWEDSPNPPVRKTLYQLCQHVFIYNEEAPCTSHTSAISCSISCSCSWSLYISCSKVAILLLQDFSTLCATDIYGMYFHLSVQCL